MYQLYLFLHIAAAAAWIGAALIEVLQKPAIGSGSPETRAHVLRVQASMGPRFYAPAAVVVLASGILLVLNNDAVGFGTTFVSIGFLAIVFGAVVGGGLLGKRAEQVAARLDSGDVSGAHAIESKTRPIEFLDIAVLLVTLAAMVWKWGL
ncbi:MAG TPA: hypothetical protein VLB67_10110 [Acidimicrobiia bacterium]|nr:hypothetical protein [Acidimicrobiia bacterium]